MIRNQAAKLVRHSKNLDAWTASGYNDIISMANSETLSSLRQCWLQYFSPVNSSESRREAFIKGAAETYGPFEARNELYDLRKTFGALTLKSGAIAERICPNCSASRLPMTLFQVSGKFSSIHCLYTLVVCTPLSLSTAPRVPRLGFILHQHFVNLCQILLSKVWTWHRLLQCEWMEKN